MAHFPLADAVDAAETLLDPVRVPRQVVIDHEVRPLQVEAFARGIRRQEHDGVAVVGELLARRLAVFAARAAVNRDDRLRATQLRRDLLPQVVKGVLVLGEDDDLARFARVVVHE